MKLRLFNLIFSILIALLLARLVLLLLAADPAMPFVKFTLALTNPLIAPLAWLDASQPTVGVRFERATLLLVCLLIVISSLINWRQQRKAV